jgi:flagellar basal body-associated protein FliL
MGRSLVVALLAIVGLLCAAGMGYAAYVVSRGSVAVPVTRLQQQPAQQLTPARVRAKAKVKPRRTVTTTTTSSVPTTTVDDHGGRRDSGNSGHGGGGGGGGHGGDD